MDFNKDYYGILGVSKNATESEIKESFRRLAHVFHPDKNNGDDYKFKKINEACSILLDKNKRFEYDRVYDSLKFEEIVIKKQKILSKEDVKKSNIIFIITWIFILIFILILYYINN